ncbi:hypothetical protein P43SY_009649 [Pythium insidiosum]|uniref:Uncharacterized protein n=1 Tax=Pythium insidiosum TaxID=114742 RepID=A0AAD5LC19_PYTIN|nr:hypothetical protein P43SY_009649 [Pythium insidiosum]
MKDLGVTVLYNADQTAAVTSHNDADDATKFKLRPPRLDDDCEWVEVEWDRVTPGTIQGGYKRTGLDATDVIGRLEAHGLVDERVGDMSSDVEFDDE